MASGAVAALDRIAAMVDEATTAAEEISIATQQQRSASDQVVVAMTQVSEVSQQYAAGSKQTAASSTQISTLAAAMQHSISTFNVEREGAHGDAAELVDEFSGEREEPFEIDPDRVGVLEISADELLSERFARFAAPAALEADVAADFLGDMDDESAEWADDEAEAAYEDPVDDVDGESGEVGVPSSEDEDLPVS
jgi:glycine cleavage system pyridoxal-binding protein P